ncbi:MAG TPA: enolase C-terminal domain-like protein [Candidatus Lumbricidophila sp.]|nr:enolase C-terminal domain-like protein [Candidatus Lumbricidophila sp.]
MRITAVDVLPVELPAPGVSFHWRKGLPGSGSTGVLGAVLRITTDTGEQGVAPFLRMGGYHLLTDLVDGVFRPELIGSDPLQRELLWHRIWEVDRLYELPLLAFGLVDTALWDLAARHYGVPLHELLGGFRTEVAAYASTVTFDTNAEFLDVATQSLELGYQAIKLHAYGDVKLDAKLAHDLRAHVGDDVPLMYDGSAGFNLPDAIRLGRELHDAGFLWYEEPMREFSVHAYAQLAKAVEIPLLVAETSDGAHYNSAEFIAAGTATYGVRTSAVLRGGVTGAMRIAHLADSFGIQAEVHGSDLVNRHLCMAIPNTGMFEQLVYSTTVTRAPGMDASGMIQAPTAPGIGLQAGPAYPAELAEFIVEL